MEWNNSDTDDYRVVESTYWRYILNYKGFQARAGVYIFANANNQVKYIGKAGARRMLAEISSAIRRGKDYGATNVKVLYTNSDANAQSLETDLINKYDPPNNLT